jgi:hypothetical protein
LYHIIIVIEYVVVVVGLSEPSHGVYVILGNTGPLALDKVVTTHTFFLVYVVDHGGVRAWNTLFERI